MSDSPLVSVVMPVYNAERYLPEAIESILNQTCSDFEFIIINDGSTDNTGTLLTHYGLRDERIKTKHQTNQGLVAVLNTGLDLSRGKYVVRMDADDVSLPERIEKQVTFMEAHPQIGVCGTWVKTIGQPAGHIWQYPVDDATIRCRLLFDSPLAHPAVIMRRELLTKTGLGYSHVDAEDYALWVQVAEHSQLANIPEVLLYYRKHCEQTMQQYLSKRQAADRCVRLGQLKRFGLQPGDDELELHQAISLLRVQPNKEFIIQAGGWLEQIRVANQQRLIYPEPQFSRVLAWRWYELCRAAASKLGWSAWQIFWQSSLSADADIPWGRKLKFGIRCFCRVGI